MSQQINLFNPIFMKQKKYFSVTTMLQALGLILLGSALFYGYAAYQVAHMSSQMDEMTKRYAAEQAKLVNLTNEYSRQNTGRRIEDDLKQLEARAAAQTTLLNMFRDGALGNTQGYSGYMRALARQSIKGLWLTAFDIVGDGVQMSVSGAVVDPQLVPAYIQRLGKEKVMQGKTFSTLQIQQPDDDGGRRVPRYVEFNLHSSEAIKEEQQ